MPGTNYSDDSRLKLEFASAKAKANPPGQSKQRAPPPSLPFGPPFRLATRALDGTGQRQDAGAGRDRLHRLGVQNRTVVPFEEQGRAVAKQRLAAPLPLMPASHTAGKTPVLPD